MFSLAKVCWIAKSLWIPMWMETLAPKPSVTELSSGIGRDFSSRGSPQVQEKWPNAFTDSVKASKLRVAYQGIPGAYSEAATMKAFPYCEAVPSEQFEDAIKASESWRAERTVIPIENSLGGSVHCNYDLLLHHTLHIVGETHLVVDHCLLGLPGVRKDELKSVSSHPQALAQCTMSLKRLGVARLSVHNTAVAAKIVASDRVRENGAIASARAAQIYGLDILAEKFQDVCANVTRFLVLAREPIVPEDNGYYKTSIVFALRGGPGALVEALSVFGLRGINLCKIESRPLERHPLNVVNGRKRHTSSKYFDYFFYIDFEASIVEPRAQYALEHLQEYATSLRILGCYPMDKSLEAYQEYCSN